MPFWLSADDILLMFNWVWKLVCIKIQHECTDKHTFILKNSYKIKALGNKKYIAPASDGTMAGGGGGGGGEALRLHYNTCPG